MSHSPTDGGPSAVFTRRYDLDWLRIIAFGLLIFYHVGMFYVTWGWHVKSPHANSEPELAMMLLNPWRLALLFFISGVALRFLSDKLGSGRFALDRTLRLLPVIVFGMLVVVMPQTYFQLREMGEIEPGILAFWPRYIIGWEIAGIEVPTWNHLWYVVYLFVYCLLLAPVLPLLRRMGDSRLGRMTGRLWSAPAGPALLLIVPTLVFMLYRVFLEPHFPTTHNLIEDWANHAHRFTILLFGYFAAKSPRFWDGVRRVLPWAAGFVVAYALVFAWAVDRPDDFWDGKDAILWPLRLARIVYAWAAILTLLALAQRFLAGDGPVRRYLTEAIFPWYILHQTITVSAGYALARLGLGPWVEFALLVAATAGGCVAGFEIIRRVPLLRPLFGLRLRPARTDVSPALPHPVERA